MNTKATNYFSHDSNARNDEKLVRLRMRHGAAGYGVYFMILERLREDKNYMCATDYNMVAYDLRVDAKLIKSVVEDFGLFVFTNDGKYFYSDSFINRMKVLEGKIKKYSDAGKIGMKKRWNANNNAGNEEKQSQQRINSDNSANDRDYTYQGGFQSTDV